MHPYRTSLDRDRLYSDSLPPAPLALIKSLRTGLVAVWLGQDDHAVVLNFSRTGHLVTVLTLSFYSESF